MCKTSSLTLTNYFNELQKISPDKKAEVDYHFLQTALDTENFELAEQLLQHQANINSIGGNNNETLSMTFARDERKIKQFNFLLKHHINVSIVCHKENVVNIIQRYKNKLALSELKSKFDNFPQELRLDKQTFDQLKKQIHTLHNNLKRSLKN